jgi:hypothetical protein
MTNHATYNDTVVATIKAKAEKKQTNRQKEQEAKKLKKQAASIKAKADVLEAQYKEYERAIVKIEKQIAIETDPGVKATLRTNKERTKTARDESYKRWKTQNILYKQLTDKANILLGKKDVKNSKGKNNEKPSGNNAGKTGGRAVFPYKFNAPMVRGAYFNPTSITSKSIDEDNLSINYAPYQDALDAWKNAKPAKGALQMDREFTQNQINNFDPSNAKTKLDLQMYGFRFLYNPKEVSMGWSTQGFVDPEFVPQDEALPISTNMTASYVTFSLVINRIEDMNFIDKNGFVSAQAKKFSATTQAPIGDLDPAQRNRIYTANFIANSPYPDSMSLEDLKEIYEKGTMYDLEYLFKTINGPAATFTNKYGIQTADRSYMRLAILELHLGNSMRYRGRITDLEVNHTIFNSRMIPLFSTVRISLARINDAYVLPDNTGKK